MSTFISTRRPRPARPEVLPREPELQRTPPARPLQAEPVEVEAATVRVRLSRGIAAATVVLGPVRERALEQAPVAEEQARRRRAPGRTTCAGSIVRESARSSAGTRAASRSRQPRRPAVGGVDMEPSAFGLGKVGEILDRVDRPGVRRAGRARRSRTGCGRRRGRPRWPPRPARPGAGSGRRPGCSRARRPGSPAIDSARATEKCVWSDTYTRAPSRSRPRGGVLEAAELRAAARRVRRSGP